ncbi:hypothetical protein [Paenibacillus pinihumi]|uniref:hypothetical protein n=1 Tax=Paenibacillus pinihumi TaxID=669462 RepID=UPI0003FDDB8A|nr:hypothetical protein [Paenibacillus pinihumi]
MKKTMNKFFAAITMLALVAVLLLPASANAAYVPYTYSSPGNPVNLYVGDWSFPVLAPGDTHYFKFQNQTGVTRNLTFIVQSPAGVNYVPFSISGSGILSVNPVQTEFGLYRYEYVILPNAVLDIQVKSFSGYSSSSYFIVTQ